MIGTKILVVLSIIIVGSYATLWILGSFEWFKEYKDAGATFCFDLILGLTALLTGIIGVYSIGYTEGKEDVKKENSESH